MRALTAEPTMLATAVQFSMLDVGPGQIASARGARDAATAGLKGKTIG
jgi:hypothetical protein